VTGGLGGIGWAVASRFVGEGANVLVTDLSDDGSRVATELPGSAHYMRHDVRSRDSWDAAVSTAVERFDRLDILINNAGIWRPSLLMDFTVDDAQLSFEINQLGPMLGMQAAAPTMRVSGGGSIVNLGSGVGMAGAVGQMVYSATKWAVRGITKSAALELGAFGIRVNAILPGSIDTPMTASIQRPADGNPFGFLPIPRRGLPEEVAALALHLASDESSYTTGAEVTIDGGLTAGLPMPSRVHE